MICLYCTAFWHVNDCSPSRRLSVEISASFWRALLLQRPHLRAAAQRARKNRGGALKWKFNSRNNLNCKIITSAQGAESEKEAAARAKEQLRQFKGSHFLLTACLNKHPHHSPHTTPPETTMAISQSLYLSPRERGSGSTIFLPQARAKIFRKRLLQKKNKEAREATTLRRT